MYQTVTKRKMITINGIKKYISGETIQDTLKSTGIFAALISGFKKVGYVNGDILDCRLCNINNIQVAPSLPDDKQTLDSANYSYQCSLNDNYDDYNKNAWILGKTDVHPFQHDNEWIIKITKNGVKYAKVLSFKKYGSNENAYSEAIKEIFLMSYRAGTTTNMIRKITDKVIEVKLSTGDVSMFVDIFFIPVVQYYIWSKYNDHNKSFYPVTYVNDVAKRFKNIIGLYTTTNKDGNLFNNCLNNLYFSKCVLDTEQLKNNTLKISQLNICNLYNLNKTKEDIQSFGEYLIGLTDHQVNSIADFHMIATHEDYKKCKKYLQEQIDKIYSNINFDYTTFIPAIPHTNEKWRMFNGFIAHFMERIHNYNQKILILDSQFQTHMYDPVYNFYCADVYTGNRKIPKTINDINDINDIDETNALNSVTSSEKIMDINNKEQIKEITDIKKNNIYVQQFRDIVIKNGGEPLFADNDYKSAHFNLPVKCKDGHEFTISLNNIKRNRWCPICNSYKSELLSIKLIEHIFNKPFPKVRPLWLKNKEGNNLELDGYNEELKLAIEYNGIQHYEYVHYFHKTLEAFEKLKDHDKLKAEICAENNISLIVVKYTIFGDEIQQYICDTVLNLGFKPININTKFNISCINSLVSKHEDFKNTVKNKGGELISGVYYDMNSKFIIRCTNGHEFVTTPRNVNKQHWCPPCSHIKTPETIAKTSASMKALFLTKEGREQIAKSSELCVETKAQKRDDKRATETEKTCYNCKLTLPIENFTILGVRKPQTLAWG